MRLTGMDNRRPARAGRKHSIQIWSHGPYRYRAVVLPSLILPYGRRVGFLRLGSLPVVGVVPGVPPVVPVPTVPVPVPVVPVPVVPVPVPVVPVPVPVI